MFIVRRVLSSKTSLALKVFKEQFINPRNLVIPFSRDISFGQQRFCVSRLQQEPSEQTQEEVCTKYPLGVLQGKLKLCFTCKKCDTRNNKTISKLGYEKGVVIVRCDGCQNNHLIADNLGWFGDKNRSMNIERLLREKGENVRRVRDNVDGYMEFIANEVLLEVQKQQKLNNLPEPNISQDEELEKSKFEEFKVRFNQQEAENSANEEVSEGKR